MAEPLFIDPLDHTDTELGAAVRDAHARGTRVVLLLTVPDLPARDRGAGDVIGRGVACGDDAA